MFKVVKANVDSLYPAQYAETIASGLTARQAREMANDLTRSQERGGSQWYMVQPA